jgi:hypothetical protein
MSKLLLTTPEENILLISPSASNKRVSTIKNELLGIAED